MLKINLSIFIFVGWQHFGIQRDKQWFDALKKEKKVAELMLWEKKWNKRNKRATKSRKHFEKFQIILIRVFGMENEIKKRHNRNAQPKQNKNEARFVREFFFVSSWRITEKTLYSVFYGTSVGQAWDWFFFHSIFLHTHIFNGLYEKNGNIFAKHNDKTFDTGTKTMPLQKPNHMIFV